MKPQKSKKKERDKRHKENLFIRLIKGAEEDFKP
jgi:hypothetical protein